MKPFMPQECSFKLFTSDGAVVQRKMLLGSKYKLLPHITYNTKLCLVGLQRQITKCSALPNYVQVVTGTMCSLQQNNVMLAS